MKHTILFFVFVILSTNCQQQKTISIQKGTTTQSSTAIVMSIDSTVVAKANTTEPKIKVSKNDSLLKILQEKYGEDYESYQRAVRKLVLQQMKYSILKNTCLEEFYLQGFAKTTKDSIKVHLPFNLHTFDCGAPDCYTTEVSFRLTNEKPIVFPDSLPFYEEQWGCMEKYQFSDVYELIEATDKHVIYHCPTKRRTLVLYFPKIKGSWSGNAYYFAGVGRKRFNGKNIYTVHENYNDNKPESEWNKAPYMITNFNRLEYEFMLKE